MTLLLLFVVPHGLALPGVGPQHVLHGLSPLRVDASAARAPAIRMELAAEPARRRQSYSPQPQSSAVTMVAPPSNAPVPKNIDWVFDNNKEWVERTNKRDPELFSRLANGQNPRFLWIGCADSRVPANRILGLDVGDVFVHRNIANQALGSDINCMSVIQYAVNVLKVPHIIVCGHYDCGGVRASMENTNHGSPLENWLRNIRDVYRLNRQELDAIADPAAKQRRLVEINVVEQCLNIFKTGVVQRRRLATFCDPESEYTQPRIHAMVYDVADGILKELDVNWAEKIAELRNIYDLYDFDAEGCQVVYPDKTSGPMPS